VTLHENLKKTQVKQNKLYLNQSPEFWATIRLLSQKLGYTKRKNRVRGELPVINIPTIEEVFQIYKNLNLNINKLFFKDKLTDLGTIVFEYFKYRAKVLNGDVQHNLMDIAEATEVFKELRNNYEYKIPLAYNKQKKDQQIPLYFTSIINSLIEANIGAQECSYSAGELTAFTQHKFPVRSMSRRMDGAFPRVINPVAVWEIKEYYYTTSFGSKVADAVYETMLDGYELMEVRKSLNIDIKHYLMIDGKTTWWKMGRSYLCKLIDAMHMGLITEVIFGKEVLERIPALTKEWSEFYNQHKSILENQ
jgi:hypothetical protein